jgi:biotin operon repressor
MMTVLERPMIPRNVVGYVDEFGEIHEGPIPVLVGRKNPSPYGDDWMQINQNFLREFAARKDVTGEVMRVFLYLNARLDFENWFLVPQTEIAEELGLCKQNVHRAMHKLEDLGVIFRGPKVGRSSSWRLNPNAGWKGKISHLRREIRRLKAVE